MYDFEDVRKEGFRQSMGKRTSLEVIEITKQHHSRNVGSMTIAAIMSKFS